ncbi:hypothetical protein F5Y16DRAFT_169788 [Xylariaceae sp. FL0255]|nr:hypothetical protein F5Y16DRAFT_169788 [Xylariaceae sp. FL0255]
MSNCSLSSEDDFPDVQVIFEKQKLANDLPVREALSTVPANTGNISPPVKATPMRRRKFAPAQQPIEASLRKPWLARDAERSHINSSRQPSWVQSRSAESSMTSGNESLDRLPVKPRAGASVTMFDSPPAERKKAPTLLTQAQRAVTEKLGALDESSASDSDKDQKTSFAPSVSLFSRNDGSTLISDKSWGTEDRSIGSDDLFTTTPGPRRLQKRILSSSIRPGFKDTPFISSRKINFMTEPRKRLDKKGAVTVSGPLNSDSSATGGLEDVFEKLKIFSDEPKADAEAKDESRPLAEPITPRKTLIASPSKIPNIPISPWKPEQKEFWDPEVNFAWIDKHSPAKESSKKLLFTPAKKDEKDKYTQSPEKKLAKKNFDGVKEDLARDFLLELDEIVTEGELAKLTENTGGLRIVWSNTLLTTAGRAHWKCKTTTTTKQPSSASTPSTKTTTSQHYASIELATKVLTNESDLLNTVAHEFCHLAVFLLHGKPKLAHGTEFKALGNRVMAASLGESKYLEIPNTRGVEINVTTRHSYEIDYRFIWRCADCDTEVCRHSRSVDPVRQRCGKCTGQLVQMKPVPRGPAAATKKAAVEGGQGAKKGKGTAQPKIKDRKKTAYQEFTAREMKELSITHKGITFKEKMAIVSARWKEYQAMQKEKASRIDVPDAEELASAVETLRVEDDATEL